MTAARRVRWEFLTSVIGVVAGGGFVWAMDREAVLGAVRSVGAWGLLAACAWHLAVLGWDARIMRVALLATGPAPSWPHCLAVVMTGHALNQVTPGGQAGEVLKYARLRASVGGGRALAATVLTNAALACSALGLLALGSWCGAAMVLRGTGASWAWAGVAVGAGLLLAAGVLGRCLLHGAAATWRPWETRVLWWRRPRAAARWMARKVDHHLLLPLGPRARPALTAAVGSATCAVAEVFMLLWLMGAPSPVLLALASRAAAQLLVHVANWVPLQAGTAEVGAWATFSILSADPALGVTVELLRKVRATLFIAVGLLLHAAWRHAAANPVASAVEAA